MTDGDEDTGEFIELYNAGSVAIDVAGLVITDGDDDDVLQAYGSGTTSIPAGGYAVVLDAEYAGEYAIDSSVILLTTADTTLGNGLSVKNELTLYEADGTNVIDAFLYPSNPGNAVSVERVSYGGSLDAADNWLASTCAAGGSPGADNCVSGSGSGSTTSGYDIVLTEVMANASDESTGEFIELYNNGSTDIDLLYWIVYDGDAVDTILGFTDPYDTVLPAGGYAIILDSDYAGEYSIPSGALVLTTDDKTIGSGLAVNDPVYIYEDNAVSLVDSFTFPWDPGNATSIERIDITGADEASNWQESTCSGGSSPGQGTCP